MIKEIRDSTIADQIACIDPGDLVHDNVTGGLESTVTSKSIIDDVGPTLGGSNRRPSYSNRVCICFKKSNKRS